MQASGLLQLLPKLFASLIQRMQAASAGITSQLKPLHPPSSTTSCRQEGSASSSSGPLPGVPDPLLLMLPVAATLHLYVDLSKVWPGMFAAEVVPDSTAAVLQLCWLVFQFMDRQLSSWARGQSVFEDTLPVSAALLNNTVAAAFVALSDNNYAPPGSIPRAQPCILLEFGPAQLRCPAPRS